MAEVINYTRLTTSDKLQDRFLTCQVYQPVDPEQAQSGMIFSQIEILSPWFPTSQVGQTVINTLIREYYRGSDTSDLVNFENAVKKVNEALAQIAQNGETDWIGKFSGVLMLVNGKEAHFAQTGLSQAYLYRGTHLNHITEGLNGDEPPHPLKTFSNLTSGSLQEGDKIVVANASFFETISPTDIKMLVTSFRPTITAIEAAKLLRNQKDGQNSNALFLELTNKEELASVPPDQKIEAVYLDQPMFSLTSSLREFFSSVVIPGAKKTGRFVGEKLGQGKEKLAPHLKRGFEKSKAQAGRAVSAISASSRKTKESLEEPAQSEPTSEAQDTTKSKNSFNLTKVFLKFKNKLRRFLIHSGLYSRKKSKMILAILIGIVLILGLTVTYSLIRRSSAKKTSSLQATMSQIGSLETSASLANSKQDEENAVSAYQQIISLALTLKGTKFESEASKSSQKAQEKITEITKLKTLSPVAQIDAKTEGINLATFSGNIYLFSKNGEIFAKKPSDKDFVSAASSKQKNAISSTALPDDKQIAYVTSDKTIGIFDPQKKSFTVQPVQLAFAGLVRNFGSTLYVLDQPSNQIYKINRQDGSYSNSSGYLKDNSVISDSVDLAIDGSVYLLSPDGKISRFSRGNKTKDISFDLPAQEKLAGYKRLFTSDSVETILLFSDTNNQARLIEIGKSGNFIGQYKLENASGAQDITIDQIERNIYVLKGNKVLSFQF